MAELTQIDAARALLTWYAEMGVDEAVGAEPADFFARSAPRQRPVPERGAAGKARSGPPIAPIAPTAALSADEAIKAAEQAAAAAKDFADLAAAVEAFEHCPLKSGARRTVFADGAAGADLLVLGEAPGRDEDQQGKPFVGRAGQLLDLMLAAIGRSRDHNVLISNVIYWRPPGNRTPSQVEMAICRPFVDRLIEIVAPKAILLAGGVAMQSMLGVAGIMRARGVWREIQTPGGFTAPALPTFHPAFLLRSPAQKRLAWADLLALQDHLSRTS